MNAGPLLCLLCFSRGATLVGVDGQLRALISTHTPLARGDSKTEQKHCLFLIILYKKQKFNPDSMPFLTRGNF